MKDIKIELQNAYGTDKDIANAAWTSSYDYEKKLSRTEEDVKRVVNMLADSKHSVPFESVIFRFWFKLPISADRQLMTHRIASHSGMSGRYRTMPREWQEVPKDVKDILNISTPEYISEYEYLCGKNNEFYERSAKNLKIVQDRGWITNQQLKRAREFLRGVLPQNNMTERVTIMNLRSFANFYKLRSKEDAQPEIRYIAQEMLKQVKEANCCPVAIEALERNEWSI
jgi:flavin-dependent thymidylate synthase